MFPRQRPVTLSCTLGLKHLWESGKWRELVGGGSADLGASQLLACPRLPAPDTDPQYGLRRGLMEAMLRLSVTREVSREGGPRRW